MIIHLLILTLVYNCPTLQQCQIDCRIKHKGTMNYYNQQTKQCEKVKDCNANEYYDYDSNTCIFIENNSNNKTNNDNKNESLPLNGTLVIAAKVVCVNGQNITYNGSGIVIGCRCEQGWTDDQNQQVVQQTVYRCNVKKDDNYSNVNYSDPNYQRSLVGNQQSQGFIDGLSIEYEYVIYAVVLLLILVGCFCLKRKIRQKRKKKKSNKQMMKFAELQRMINQSQQSYQKIEKEYNLSRQSLVNLISSIIMKQKNMELEKSRIQQQE